MSHSQWAIRAAERATRCRCSLARRASSILACSSTSVLVPNQASTRPSASSEGSIRVRNLRNRPSTPRSGKTISNGRPSAIDRRNRSRTPGRTSGSWTDFHPQPSIESSVVPVYSYQRRLYQVMWPSGRAIQASWVMDSASRRNRASPSRSASLARESSAIRSATSRPTASDSTNAARLGRPTTRLSTRPGRSPTGDGPRFDPSAGPRPAPRATGPARRAPAPARWRGPPTSA